MQVFVVLLCLEALLLSWASRSPRKKSALGVQWRVNDLTDEATRLTSVYESSKASFTYFDAVVARHMANFVPGFRFVSVGSASEVCTSPFRYYSGALGDSLSEERSKIFGSIFGRLLGSRSLPDDSSMNVWIGGLGVHATPHYDSVHNVFLQVVGTKTVTLLHPKHGSSIFLHGRLHPYACQSRFQSLHEPTLLKADYYKVGQGEMCGNCKDDTFLPSSTANWTSDIVVVSMNPGDVLYIPPYWLHETVVESKCSMSASLWWDPAEATAIPKLLARALPLEETWDAAFSAQVMAVYLAHFIRSFSVNEESDQQMLVRLLTRRYWEDLAWDPSGLPKLATTPPIPNGIVEKARRYASSAMQFLREEVRAKVIAEDSAHGNAFFNQEPRMVGNEGVQYEPSDGVAVDEEYIESVSSLIASHYIEECAMFAAAQYIEAGLDTLPPDFYLSKQTSWAIAIIHKSLQIWKMGYV